VLFRSPKPWWTESLSIKWKEVVEAERDFLKYRGTKRGKALKQSRYKFAIKSFDRAYRRSKRQYFAKQGDEIEELQSNDPKEFWKRIQQLGPRKTREDIPIETTNEDGSPNMNVQDVLGVWQAAFEELYQSNGDFDDEFYNRINDMKRDFDAFADADTPENDPTNIQLMDAHITYKEVQSAISRAKLNKASGFDHIPNEVLKNKPTVHLLQKLFNVCFFEGVIPEPWCKSIIRPIPKNSTSDKRLPTNYRGISLLSNIYKLYTSVLNTRLVTYLEDNNKIVEEQNGFRKLRACVDHIFALTCILKNRKLEGKETFACFIDMRRAFDTVARSGLMFKLSQVGVCKFLYKAIDIIHQKTECCILINSYLTNWFNTLGGVKQGDGLSPSLFNVYINDLATEINRLNLGVKVGDEFVNILLYADDIVIIADNETNLQNMLDTVYKWCRQWRMTVNNSKTQVVHFRKKSIERTEKMFKCGTDKIEVVAKYKYLGCILEEHLDFSVIANALSEAAGRAVGSLVNKCVKINNFRYDTYTKLYDSCVIPIMDYASGIWGYNRYDKPNVIQNRAIRSFLGVHRYTSNIAIQGDMAWRWPIVRRKLEMLKLFKRICLMSNQRLAKTILLWDWQHKGRTWSWCIRSILKDTDQGNLNIDVVGGDIDFDELITKAEEVLMRIEVDRWSKELSKQPKLRFYRLFKNTFETATYVKQCASKSARSFIAQIRSGVLPLKVEVGRFMQKKLEERNCDICKSDNIEDEMHFIFTCPMYEVLRKDFFTYVAGLYNIDLMPNCDMLSIFMNDKKVINRFGSFIRNCFYKRNDNIFFNSVS
jgi:hypothetical protein